MSESADMTASPGPPLPGAQNGLQRVEGRPAPGGGSEAGGDGRADNREAEYAERIVTVRATINLPGLRRGETAVVDPDIPYIADCITAGYLVEAG